MEVVKFILLFISGFIIFLFVGGFIVHLFSTIFWKAGMSEFNDYIFKQLHKTNEKETK